MYFSGNSAFFSCVSKDFIAFCQCKYSEVIKKKDVALHWALMVLHKLYCNF